MQRKQDNLIPVGDIACDLPQPRHHLTRTDPV